MRLKMQRSHEIRHRSPLSVAVLFTETAANPSSAQTVHVRALMFSVVSELYPEWQNSSSCNVMVMYTENKILQIALPSCNVRIQVETSKHSSCDYFLGLPEPLET